MAGVVAVFFLDAHFLAMLVVYRETGGRFTALWQAIAPGRLRGRPKTRRLVRQGGSPYLAVKSGVLVFWPPRQKTLTAFNGHCIRALLCKL